MSLPLSATVRLHCHRRAVVSLQLLRSKRQIRPADPRGPPSVVYNCTQRAHRFCPSVRPSVASSSYRATSSSVATSERGSRDEPAAGTSKRPTDRPRADRARPGRLPWTDGPARGPRRRASGTTERREGSELRHYVRSCDRI